MPKGKKAANRLPLPTPSEAAFEKLLASFLDPNAALTADDGFRAPSPQRERDEFVTHLYEDSEQYLQPRTIADAPYFHSKVKGISFEGRQDIVPGLKAGAVLTLERQPNNEHDRNAIAILFGNLQLGYIAREHAVDLAPAIDGGATYRCRIADVTGGGDRFFGINIFVERVGAARVAVSSSEVIDADENSVREALIGQHPIRKAQQDILERIAAGKNTLAVLGTGRGKSFCFQFPAAVRALDSGQKTVAIYPLRALANDQFEALRRRFDGFGLRMFRANGSIDPEERAALFAALESGAWDLIFATPEFLQFHRDAFSQSSRPSLVVVDEAHHLHESRHREAYNRLGLAIRELGAPQVLALTATAGDQAFAETTRQLAIEAWVIDPTVRENLHVVDARGTRDKIAYLRELFERSGRAIVYCNSKRETVKVADELRRSYGNEVVYYHAGLGSDERLKIEGFFREGAVRVVVATSAFGEGIDLPDVRDVVLYHLNFNFTEFNQQAGRAGRDGADARIHLLFNKEDRSLNEFLISFASPTLSTLREIYKGMRGLARDAVLHMSATDIVRTLDLPRTCSDETIKAAVQIFEESGLVERGSDEVGKFMRFLPARTRIDLTKNERFAEGEAERENFAKFASYAFDAGPDALEAIINRPIYPQNVPLLR